MNYYCTTTNDNNNDDDDDGGADVKLEVVEDDYGDWYGGIMTTKKIGGIMMTMALTLAMTSALTLAMTSTMTLTISSMMDWDRSQNRDHRPCRHFQSILLDRIDHR